MIKCGFRAVRGALVLSCVPLAVAACSGDDNNNNNTDASVDGSVHDGSVFDSSLSDAAHDGAADAVSDVQATTDGADGATDAQALTDAQIVGFVETANLGEISDAILAVGLPDGGLDAGLDGGFDASALGFDAGAVPLDAGGPRASDPRVIAFANMMIADHGQSNAVVSGFGIAPAESPLQQTLLTMAEATTRSLEPLTGSAFDVAYVQAQVTAHTTVRDAIMNQLIPAASNAQLKSYLSTTLLPTVQMHLTDAQALLAALTDAGAGDASVDAAEQ